MGGIDKLCDVYRRFRVALKVMKFNIKYKNLLSCFKIYFYDRLCEGLSGLARVCKG